ncbi:unnamed protein product [Echinostoma caproni]|uniref:Protein FAM114A2 n=1 Tax=Echinostoma caproni TaxID=27848 RepID=A0A183AQR2_9TREM|nr:unnamed protein product [Echinostoma caproni]
MPPSNLSVEKQPELKDAFESDTFPGHPAERENGSDKKQHVSPPVSCHLFGDQTNDHSLNGSDSPDHMEADLSNRIKPNVCNHTIPEGDEDLWNPELLTATATHLVRGVGDGLSSLADALAQAVSLGTKADEEYPQLLERRKQRALEEKAERQAISEAWSNVWNTAWGTNDGWDVDDVDLPESSDNKQKQSMNLSDITEDVCVPETSDRENRAQESSKSESSAFWDWSGVSSLAQQITSSFQTTIIREAHERQKTENSHESTTKEFNRGNFTAQLESKRALIHLEALELVSDKAESQLHIQLDNLATTNTSSEELSLDGGVLEAIWKTLQIDMGDEDENDEFPDQSTWKILKCKKQQLQPGSYGPHPTDLSEANTLVWVAFERSLSLIKTIYPGEKLLQVLSQFFLTHDEVVQRRILQSTYRIHESPAQSSVRHV